MSETPQNDTIPLAEIELGERRREDYGDIAKLAAGIEKVGLIHPLIVRRVNGHFQLVSGGRRLKALQLLKAESAPVRLFETLSDDELRAIEIEENESRKDFSEHERRRTFAASSQMVEDAKKAAKVISEGASEIKTASNPKGAGRKPKDEASKDEVAAAIGVSRPTLRDAEQHVETATTFPFMQSWRQSEVLAVRETLENLPSEEREDAMGVLGCARILAGTDGAKLARNIAAKQPKARKELYALSKSDDPRDRSKALSCAAERPPMPDPRLNSIETALAALGRATTPYPRDPLTPEFREVIATLKRLRARVEAVSFDARRDAKKGVLQ